MWLSHCNGPYVLSFSHSLRSFWKAQKRQKHTHSIFRLVLCVCVYVLSYFRAVSSIEFPPNNTQRQFREAIIKIPPSKKSERMCSLPQFLRFSLLFKLCWVSWMLAFNVHLSSTSRATFHRTHTHTPNFAIGSAHLMTCVFFFFYRRRIYYLLVPPHLFLPHIHSMYYAVESLAKLLSHNFLPLSLFLSGLLSMLLQLQAFEFWWAKSCNAKHQDLWPSLFMVNENEWNIKQARTFEYDGKMGNVLCLARIGIAPVQCFQRKNF